jgi:hypothetical protein
MPISFFAFLSSIAILRLARGSCLHEPQFNRKLVREDTNQGEKFYWWLMFSVSLFQWCTNF